jgi:hypothetical protein
MNVFHILELVVFTAPAFLPTWPLRLTVLAFYYVIHLCGVQQKYKQYKKSFME